MAKRLRLPTLGVELPFTALAATVSALIAFAGVHKLGTGGVLLPVAAVVGVIVLSRPLLAVSSAVALTIFCEGESFGLLTFTSKLYSQVYRDINFVDLLVAMAVLSVGLDVLRNRRAIRIPRPLALPFVLIALAMLSGVVVGHAGGATIKVAFITEHTVIYLIFLPLAIANLDVTREQLKRLLAGLMVLAVIKALLGLLEVAGHFGTPIEGASTLSYYEPAANWLIMTAMLAVFAAFLFRAKPPLWMLLSSPLLFACLLLSYRRSFWIGAILGFLLVLLLATTPTARRMLVPGALAVAAAIWALGAISFQSQIPAVKRFETLNPNKLEQNVQDRYRLDERANVFHEIKEHPIEGLGITIPWKASTQTLSIEHEGGRQYVHFAALWWWLKLGILGLLAYISVIACGLVLGYQAWRRAMDPLQRAFGLASMCSFAGLIAIDTTASFTGVDARFTVVIAAQLGLLTLVRRLSVAPEPAELTAAPLAPATA